MTTLYDSPVVDSAYISLLRYYSQLPLRGVPSYEVDLASEVEEVGKLLY